MCSKSTIISDRAYKYQSDNNISFFHKACYEELSGTFKDAYDNYLKYINNEWNSMDAMTRILRLFHHMYIFRYQNSDIDVNFEWRNILDKIDLYFKEMEKENRNINYFEIGNYYYSSLIYNNYIKSDNEDKFKPEKSFITEEYSFMDAIDFYNKAIEENPMDATLYLWKGCYLYWSGRYVAALNAYNEALKYDNDPLILIRKGEAYCELNLIDQALKSYYDALKFSSCWLHKAFILDNIHKIIQTNEGKSLLQLYNFELNSLIIEVKRNTDFKNCKTLESNLNEIQKII